MRQVRQTHSPVPCFRLGNIKIYFVTARSLCYEALQILYKEILNDRHKHLKKFHIQDYYQIHTNLSIYYLLIFVDEIKTCLSFYASYTMTRSNKISKQFECTGLMKSYGTGYSH